MARLVVVMGLLFLFHTENFAQRSCGFYQCLQKAEAINPSIRKQKAGFEQQQLSFNDDVATGKKRLPDTIFIPVVFHVLWHKAIENISEEQIISQVNIFNNDFNALNADTINTPAYFKPLRGKTHFYFQLVKQDPDGVSTNGITRKYTSNKDGFSLDGAVCSSVLGGDDAWNPHYYVNIWICNMQNASGTFAATYFPGGSFARDGIQCDYHYVGTGGITQPPYNLGRTLTHEMGHYFNLDHVWGPTDVTLVPFCGDDDHVEDTPPQSKANYYCPSFPKSSCGNYSDMFMSYMDYVDDGCMNLFSKGQVQRMIAAYFIMTPDLKFSKALQTPQTFNTDAGISKILNPKNNSYTCSNTIKPVVVLRNYGKKILNSVKINYGIKGEAAQTMQLKNLHLLSLTTDTIVLNSFSFISKGSFEFYAATSQPDNTIDSQFVNNSASIIINENNEEGLPLPLAENFNEPFPPKGWSVLNPDNLFTWTPTSGAQRSGYAPSIMMDNIESPFINRKDYLITPPLDLSASSNPVLIFDHAFQLYKAGRPVSDTLEILVSADCGNNWQRIYYKGGHELVTKTPPERAYLSPDTKSDWHTDTIPLAAFKQYNNILIEFVNTCGRENLLYLDNIYVKDEAPLFAIRIP